jgi:hypothetical protein
LKQSKAHQAHVRVTNMADSATTPDGYQLTSDADASAAAAAANEVDDIDSEPPALEEATEAARPAVRDTPEGDATTAQMAAMTVAKLELNKPTSVYHLQLGMQETDRIIDEVDGCVWPKNARKSCGVACPGHSSAIPLERMEAPA